METLGGYYGPLIRSRKEIPMCMPSGCGKPDDTMGDERNITRQDLQDAADAAGISMQEAVRNIATTAAKAA